MRLVTVSPEWPDTPDYVRALNGNGSSCQRRAHQGNRVNRSERPSMQAQLCHSPRQWRTHRAPQNRQLHLASACGRTSFSQLHPRRHPHSGRVLQDGSSRKGVAHSVLVNGCSDAGHVQARLLSARLGGRRITGRQSCCAPHRERLAGPRSASMTQLAMPFKWDHLVT